MIKKSFLFAFLSCFHILCSAISAEKCGELVALSLKYVAFMNKVGAGDPHAFEHIDDLFTVDCATILASNRYELIQSLKYTFNEGGGWRLNLITTTIQSETESTLYYMANVEGYTTLCRVTLILHNGKIRKIKVPNVENYDIQKIRMASTW